MTTRKSTKKENNLPEISSKYRGWSIWIDKDSEHKYKTTAILRDSYYEEEIDRIEIYGDEIPGCSDVDYILERRIDEREAEREEQRNWVNNYHRIMNLPGDWEESFNPD